MDLGLCGVEWTTIYSIDANPQREVNTMDQFLKVLENMDCKYKSQECYDMDCN